jgi:hypothetical protein
VIAEKMAFEKRLILEEVQYLLERGYRPRQALEISEGMEYAASEFDLKTLGVLVGPVTA